MLATGLNSANNMIDRMRAITKGPKHNFFGYHDKCPWDATGRYMLTLEVDFVNRIPGPEDIAVIGLVDLNDDCKIRPVAETRAWNWQQGAMLQWTPWAPDRLIIYNDREGDHYVSILLDAFNGELRTLPLPIYALNPKERYALSINFSRLHDTRLGYGYAGVPDPDRDDPHPENDGIWLMDLETGNYQLVISLAELASFRPVTSMRAGKHWVNHLLFNPDGSRFCFFHRWELSDGAIYTRFLTANSDGSELYCLSDSGMVSHFCWKNSSQILAWARQSNVAGLIRQKDYVRGGLLRRIMLCCRKLGIQEWVRHSLIREKYLLFTDLTGDVETVGSGILTADGHCSYSPDGQWILTDTYPDKNGYKTLILYQPEQKVRVDIGRFYSLPNIEQPPIRCDLHPRWNRDGTQVCVDSIHEGERRIYVVDVEDIIQSKDYRGGNSLHGY